jgi:hypothetical protein
MPRCLRRRTFAALMLAITLFSPWVSAAELRGRAEPRAERLTTQEMPVLFGQLWGVLTRLFTGSPTKCDAGAEADPNGRCGH